MEEMMTEFQMKIMAKSITHKQKLRFSFAVSNKQYWDTLVEILLRIADAALRDPTCDTKEIKLLQTLQDSLLGSIAAESGRLKALWLFSAALGIDEIRNFVRSSMMTEGEAKKLHCVLPYHYLVLLEGRGIKLNETLQHHKQRAEKFLSTSTTDASKPQPSLKQIAKDIIFKHKHKPKPDGDVYQSFIFAIVPHETMELSSCLSNRLVKYLEQQVHPEQLNYFIIYVSKKDEMGLSAHVLPHKSLAADNWIARCAHSMARVPDLFSNVSHGGTLTTAKARCDVSIESRASAADAALKCAQESLKSGPS
jgi:hypothetical protein